MANESRMTLNFLKQLRHQFPKAVVIKNNDRTTGGIPDATFTYLGFTLWLEFKRDKPALTDLQRITLGKLDAATHGRALVVVFNTKTKGIDIFDYREQLQVGLTQEAAVSYLLGVLQWGRA